MSVDQQCRLVDRLRWGFLKCVGLLIGAIAATTLPELAAAQSLAQVRKTLKEEVRFRAFDKIELGETETCPPWVDMEPRSGGCRRLSVLYRGVYLSGILIQHAAPSGSLTMYHVGHEAEPQGNVRLRDTTVKLLQADAAWFVSRIFQRGPDVLILFMPGMGLEPADESRSVQELYKLLYNHNVLSLLDLPGDGAAAYFVAHVKAFLDEFGKGYRNVTMIGRSGGGWATTLASAVEPRIACSISFFGTLPLRLRLPMEGDQRNDLGDYEQYGLSLLRRVDYLDLYAAATVPGRRRHTQVYNFRDDCCFSGEVKGVKTQELFLEQYPDVRGFNVDILPIRSEKDHGNLDDSALALVDQRCPEE